MKPIELSETALKHLKGIKSDDQSVKLVQETAVLKEPEVTAKVIDFAKHRLTAFNGGEVILREMTADEAADEFLNMNKAEHKNRIEMLSDELLNAWEELLIVVHPNYIADLKETMKFMENEAYQTDPEAS